MQRTERHIDPEKWGERRKIKEGSGKLDTVGMRTISKNPMNYGKIIENSTWVKMINETSEKQEIAAKFNTLIMNIRKLQKVATRAVN